ncbi:hypothetical protein CDL12_19067 [Handroanthus impetiginosus]|uniref:WRKY domain-containing protein n=1 Tax=Handroanthus impetiginosus TaxID=429701 RepID=A0A2G9GT18_9LAMI|nr:hypothetical protein CDL12_19067 [Handroanthus impetiginosus]
MDNYQTMFHSSSSSSSSTIPQSSHLSLLNMVMNSHAQDHQYLTMDNYTHSQGNNTATFEGNNSIIIDMKNETKPRKKKGDKGSKKARYAFETRSQVDILDDGYRWRKYGQKAVKNNKFPRSYYRCTHQGCNVKKQVQRLSKDEEIVVTTYEGMHSHPIQTSTDNFEHILKQMRIYSSF